jgi:hypothetical protein
MANDLRRSDPWLAEPFPAGPMQPLITPFGARSEDKLEEKPQWQHALDEFGQLLSAEIPHDPRARLFAMRMENSSYAEHFYEGFWRGYLAGGLRGAADTIGELQNLIATYTGEPPALTLALINEVARYMFEGDPKISNDTRYVLETSEMVTLLKLLAVLSVKNSWKGFLEDVDLLAADLIRACKQAIQESGREWLDEFLSANGNPKRQGILAGELHGRAVFEVVLIYIDLLMR